MKTMLLALRGDKKKNPTLSRYRSMTFEEAKTLKHGEHPFVLLNDGTVGQVKINGKVRLWKRDVHRIEIPTKYGLYENYTFTERDIDRFLVKLSDTEEPA